MRFVKTCLLFLILSWNLSAIARCAERAFEMPKNPVVVIETNQGNIEIALKPDVAPKACENLIRHAETGYYNGLIFHRVIKNFMLHVGDPTGTGMSGESVWGSPFEDEVRDDVQFTKAGILAMANAGPHTNGSQFFITTAATPWLNGHHTIFGEVTSGMEVVRKIESTRTDANDKPLEDQKIVKMYLKKA